jgi:hypothetical protein
MGSEHILVDLQQSNWYVLFVRSNQEKRIALRLNNSGIEHLLSCYTSKRQWKDRCVRLGVPPTSPKRLSEEIVLAQFELVAMPRAALIDHHEEHQSALGTPMPVIPALRRRSAGVSHKLV